MTIRSRIGDYLFRVLFPEQARALDNVEVELVQAATTSLRAKAAVDDARRAVTELRHAMDALQDMAERLMEPSE